MRVRNRACVMLTDDRIAAVLRLAARELADTVAPSIGASHPAYVARTLGTILDELALAVNGRDDGIPGGTAPSGPHGAQRLLALVSAEQHRADAEIAEIADRQAADRAAIAAHSSDVTLARLDACLARIAGFADTHATAATRLSGGFSKETWVVTLADGRDLVLRRDMPFGPVLGSAADEAPLLRTLHARGLPVPRVVLAERDVALLDHPFLLVERMDGQNAGDLSRADPAAAKAIALGLARALGALHAVAPADAGLPNPDDPRAAVRDYLLSWRDYWIDRRLEDAAFVGEALDWLIDHVPQDMARLVIVHGDARPDNMLARADGTVTALLDWEFQHSGDAAEDVEYAWNFVQDGIDRDGFMGAYLAAGGVLYNAQNATFYSIWRAVRNLICLDTGWSGFVRGPYPVFNLGIPRLLFRRHLVKDLAQSLSTLAGQG